MDDDIIRMAREAGLSHFYDSEGDFSGVTDALLVDADKQRNDERLVEILGPLIALVRADERERIKAKPNVEYERGFIDGMQMQTKSSVDKAVNRMAEQAMLGVWQDVPGAVNFGIKKISFDEAMRLKDQMPKGLFRRVDGQAADEIWLCAIEVAERHHGITDPQVEDRLARHGIPMPDQPLPDDHDGNPSF